jgi:hypothetical protein
MSMNDSLEYNLPKNAYANFDALSLKDFIIQRLNENPVFTDQNYEGSNLAAFIDIIAFSYHVLLFYLNQTASESMFSQASLYENMNKIVGLLGYKPTGKQTSLVPVSCVASASLPIGSYVLRKYSYFLVNNIQYTIKDDFTFEKVTNLDERISSIENNLILYQGTIQEYPIYTASGENFESFPIVVDNKVNSKDDRFIAHGTISVYVKESKDGKWYEYTEVDNIFLAKNADRIFTSRLNENGHYEVKFGNGIFGRNLDKDDQVAVYYLLSDNQKGIISKNIINGNKLFNFNSSRFTEIYNSTSTIDASSIIDINTTSFLNFQNFDNSTAIGESETVEEIRNNTPKYLNSFIKLTTESDYETFLMKNLSNIIKSVKVVNNTKFISEYIDYFYKICVDPNKSNRVILNQVNFADACDFNNVNIFCVPKFKITEDGGYPPYLPNSLKNLLIDSVEDSKMLNHEIVPRDPIYMAFDLGFSSSPPSREIRNNTFLEITKLSNSRTNNETLKKKVKDVILEFFNPEKNQLGQKLDFSQLTSDILKIEGISSIRTVNNNEIYNGISFISWNPVYENVDEEYVNQTVTLPYYKFPYFYSPQKIIEKIIVTGNE